MMAMRKIAVAVDEALLHRARMEDPGNANKSDEQVVEDPLDPSALVVAPPRRYEASASSSSAGLAFAGSSICSSPPFTSSSSLRTSMSVNPTSSPLES
jgi:hypothetical protein